MKKALKVLAIVILLLAVVAVAVACNNKNSGELICDVEEVVIGKGGKKEVTVTVGGRERAANESYDVSASVSPSPIGNYGGLSVNISTLVQNKYSLTLEGIEAGEYVVTLRLTIYKNGKLQWDMLTATINVSVRDAAINVKDIITEQDTLQLGYEYVFRPVTYPENKTEGISVESSDSGIFQKIDSDENGTKFRVVGVGTAAIIVTGETFTDYEKKFTTVFGDKQIQKYVEDSYPDDKGRYNANMLACIKSIELNTQYPAENITALNAFTGLEEITLQSLAITSFHLHGMDNLTNLTIRYCSNLKEIKLTDINSNLVVQIDNSTNAINKFYAENLCSLSIIDDSFRKTLTISNLTIKNVQLLTMSDTVIKNLNTVRFEEIDGISLDNEEFVFEKAQSVAFIRCAKGCKFNFSNISGYALTLDESEPSSIDTLAGCIEANFCDISLSYALSRELFSCAIKISLKNVHCEQNNTQDFVVNKGSLSELELEEVSGLNKMSFKNSKLQKLSVKNLENLNFLEIENISNNSGASVYSISECNNISTLSIKNANDIKLFDLPNLSWLQTEVINSLSLGGGDIDEVDPSKKGMDQLKVFICNSCATIKTLNCSSLPNLLYLEAMANGALTAINVSGDTGLRVLQASGSEKLSSIVLGGTKDELNVEKIQLNDCNFTTIEFVRRMPHLKVLDMANNSVFDITAVAQLKDLQELYLNGNKIFTGNAPGGQVNMQAISTIAEKLLRLSVGSNDKAQVPTGGVKTELLSLLATAENLVWLQAYNLGLSSDDFISALVPKNESENSVMLYLDIRGNNGVSADMKTYFPNIKRLVTSASDTGNGYQGNIENISGAFISLAIDKVAKSFTWK